MTKIIDFKLKLLTQINFEQFKLFLDSLDEEKKTWSLDLQTYKNKEEFSLYKNFFSNVRKFYDQKNHLNISNNLINEKLHTLELSNWLNYIKSAD